MYMGKTDWRESLCPVVMALQIHSSWGVTVEVLVSDKGQVSTLLVGGEEAQELVLISLGSDGGFRGNWDLSFRNDLQ